MIPLPSIRVAAAFPPFSRLRAVLGRRVLPLLLLLLVLLPAPLRAAALEPLELAVRRQADGALVLDFALRVALPRPVEDALQRGVPLYFETEAAVFRPRWYWRDERVARQARQWRLSYQPLTDMYRVSLGGLHQGYASLAEALASMTRIARWRIAEPAQLDAEEGRYYVEWHWRLDTSQLPRPMQLGIGNQADWVLGIERTLRPEGAAGGAQQ
ncbi:DUF4390 domain-containing protein [Azohydromonas aeria]|uniref:DUF4390 domain-containing protein n=1 Tax=Azohydromonas aeria TaxID=2590212 RepID=UPI001E63FB72|nr:DUF4390 domain-containing protein [Azohydromonas aeria]